MLRRGLKRTEKVSTTEKQNIPLTKRNRTELVPLGSKSEKDDVEKVLEKVVLGGEEEIVDNLEEVTTNRRRRKKETAKFAPNAAWEDEDDQNITINLPSKDAKKKHMRGRDKTEVSGETYTAQLRSQFEKVCGAPSWARMRWEKDDSENDDSDTEVSELLRSTGNYLTTSDSLPKSFIQMKRCPDANKESPANCKMRSVEFHPTAQVLLAAGATNQTLSLFQVDGINNPKIQSIYLEKFPIFKAHFSADGREVIMTSKYHSFQCYDMMEGKIVRVPHLKGLEESMSKFVVSPDGRFLAFLGAYGYIHLVSAKTKEWVSSLKMNGEVSDVAFSHDGSRMLSFGSDGEVYVWDMATRDCVHRFIDDGCVKGTTLAMSQDGCYIATGSYSGVVNIYDDTYMTSHTPTPLKAVMNLTTPCTNMVFNSKTEILAISSSHSENAVKMVHLGSMSVFSNFPEKKFGIREPYCLDFSLNSGYFTIGNCRGHALLYRVKHYSNY
ncbi:U3 small nucleolar RNA-associated protein 18-like [Lamellibrachia satsuma]|nr:U3 small nucleolar RNA-associated protein 18-like [Lamellibrachia satsuma]